ncbi:GMC family oxidoreductase N-terminal domain-containing protein [Streptomyces sp. CAU 1734]|uniref:GMC family oxidoreductase n=1 Tax=Streptomyces sp. CAU 1734 TaxID=3140360 RepID=UPI003260BD7A
MTVHDYIVVGGGTAGCVLADRLSADPSVSVLLLETGGSARDERVDQPSRWPELFGGPLDWALRTEPQRQLDGRRLAWPRGRLLGGSSAVNAMVHIRGRSSDYDHWAEFGGEGWSHAALRPWFDRLEGRDGAGGDAPPARLTVSERLRHHPLAEAFVRAGRESGLAHNPDFNLGVQEGVGLYRVTQAGGRRCDAYTAYLRPALGRPNLTVLTGHRAVRVLLDAGRAIGVETRSENGRTALRAEREVILAGGTIGSPHLLLLSGIGPAGELRRHGIEAAADLPGVGENLHDHLQVSLSWATERTYPVDPGSNLGEAGGFVRTSPELIGPDVQLSFAPMSGLNQGARPGEGFTIGPAVTRPRSRGRLSLRSADPLTAPAIDPGYLTEPEDIEPLIAGVRLARSLADAPGLRVHRAARSPHPCGPSAEEITAFIRQHAQTQYHPVGTCRLGTDPRAVVDPELRVHGVAGLRVADASVMPAVPTGNTAAAVYAIAEKAAEMIGGRDRHPARTATTLPGDARV